MLVDSNDHLIVGNTQLAAQEIDNSYIGLVRHHPVDLVQPYACLLADFMRRLGQTGDSKLEHSLAIHAKEGDRKEWSQEELLKIQ